MTSHSISMGRLNTQQPVAKVQPIVTTRVAFVDKLKVALTVLVIAHHAGQAYGPTGGQWPIFSLERSPLLGPFLNVNAAFFMGLFFLISGYFLPRAYDHKGAATFLKDRFQRLGIPLVFWALLVTGPMLYFSDDAPRSLLQFVGYVYPSQIPFLIAHLWFVAHLLTYAVGYVVWRQLGPRVGLVAASEMPLPRHRNLLAYALALAMVTAIVRIWYPLNRWVTLLIVPTEIAHLPQYLSLFVIGIVAYRGDWLRRLPTGTGLTWLAIGLTAVVARYTYCLGGLQWLSADPAISHLVWNLWEACICVGLGVGLLVLFRERLNRQPGKVLSMVAGAAYAAYVIHMLVVVGLHFELDGVVLPPFTKFLLVAIAGTILSFGIAYAARQLPGAKKVL